MSSSNSFRSDLFDIHNIIQASMIVYPKEIFISTLRDFFSKDSYYHFAKDSFGFPNTTDHTDLPLGADIPQFKDQQGLSTRLFIGENYRYDGIYYPAILVKNGGAKYVPVSINREKGSVQYEKVIFSDGYNEVLVTRPKSFITAGFFEGTIVVDVYTRSLRARDDLVELIAMCFTEVNFETLYDVGLIVKPVTIGSPVETEDRNDKLFKQSLNFDYRVEYRREIPVLNLIDTILFTIEFQNLSNPNSQPAFNLTIDTEISIVDSILNMD
jgi:hypothetical protein